MHTHAHAHIYFDYWMPLAQPCPQQRHRHSRGRMPLTQIAARSLVPYMVWPLHLPSFSLPSCIGSKSILAPAPCTPLIYTQLFGKNSAGRRELKVDQDDIQAHFQLVYNPDTYNFKKKALLRNMPWKNGYCHRQVETQIMTLKWWEGQQFGCSLN